MRKRLMVLTAVLVLGLGPPPPAEAKEEATCEEICGELAAENCENIDSFKCFMYILGCLAGCSVGKIVS